MTDPAEAFIKAASIGDEQCLEKLLNEAKNQFSLQTIYHATYHITQNDQVKCLKVLLAKKNINEEMLLRSTIAKAVQQNSREKIGKFLIDYWGIDAFCDCFSRGQNYANEQANKFTEEYNQDHYTKLNVKQNTNLLDHIPYHHSFLPPFYSYVLKAMVTSGYDINILPTGIKAMLIASNYNNTDAMKILLTSPNCDINDTDKCGKTALFYAIKNNCEEGIKLLLTKKSDFNSKNKTYLQCHQMKEAMVKRNEKELMKILDEEKLFEMEDIINFKMMETAVIHGYFQIVKELYRKHEGNSIQMEYLSKSLILASSKTNEPWKQAKIVNFLLSKGICAKNFLFSFIPVDTLENELFWKICVSQIPAADDFYECKISGTNNANQCKSLCDLTRIQIRKVLMEKLKTNLFTEIEENNILHLPKPLRSFLLYNESL